MLLMYILDKKLSQHAYFLNFVVRGLHKFLVGLHPFHCHSGTKLQAFSITIMNGLCNFLTHLNYFTTMYIYGYGQYLVVLFVQL